MDYIQVDAKKVPWVFWIQVRRRKWFKWFWKSRGANHLDIQIIWFHVSIGMPWNQSNVRSELSQWGNLNNIEKTNNQNLKNPWAILIEPKQ